MTEATAAQAVEPGAATWSVYLVRCADNSLYTGIATDVVRRFAEHQAQGPKTARYLRGRAPLALVFHCPAGDRSAALKLEYRIKQLPRADKLRLVAGDLRPEFCGVTPTVRSEQ